MTVRPLQSAWRFARNELSGKPGAVHSSDRSRPPFFLVALLGLRTSQRLKKCTNCRQIVRSDKSAITSSW